jgi:hypothetical protein
MTHNRLRSCTLFVSRPIFYFESTSVDEILENQKLTSSIDSLYQVLRHLRKICNDCLTMISDPSKEATGFRVLKRVLYLFEKMASSESPVCRRSIVVADELYTVFQQWKIQSGYKGDDSKMYLVVDYVINESSAPENVLQALVLWSSSNDCGDLLFPRLKSLLRRGVHYAALKGDLSGTLLRLKHARTTFTELVLTPSDGRSSKSTDKIWDRMATGTLSIDK